MDKIKASVMLVVMIMIFGIVGYVETHDTMEGKVIDVKENVVAVMDISGNIFEYETIEQFTKGDIVEITFFNGGTATRKDDEIVKIIKKSVDK